MQRKMLQAKMPSRRYATSLPAPATTDQIEVIPRHSQSDPLPEQRQQEAPGPFDQPFPLPDPKSSPSSSASASAIPLPPVPPDLESAWSKLYTRNTHLLSQIAHLESRISHQASTILDLSDSVKQSHVASTQSTPRLAALETQLTTNISQLSLIEEEADKSVHRTVSAGRERSAAQRDAANLRRVNDSLITDRAAERRKVASLEALLSRMRAELEGGVEERLRAAVLEAENARLRQDVVAGLELVRGLVQAQQEMGIELNEQDRVAETEERRGRREKLMRGENLGELGVRFRGDSIWDGCEVGEMPVEGPVVGEEEGGGGGGGEEQEEKQEEEEEASRRSSLHYSPPPSPNWSVATSAAASTCLAVLDTADVGTQTSPPATPDLVLIASPPPLPPPASAPVPPLTTAAAAAATTTSGPSTGTQTKEPPFLPPQTTSLPLLLLLLSAFFLALYADRLAVEQQLWATANDAVQGFTAGWNGREWWSGAVGEWVGWELESWSGVERGLLG